LMSGLAGVTYEQPALLDSFLAFEAVCRTHPDPGEAFRWVTSPNSEPWKLIDYSRDIVEQIRFLSDVQSTLIEMNKQEGMLRVLLDKLEGKPSGLMHSSLPETVPFSSFSNQSDPVNEVLKQQGSNGRLP
jgi:hypothetical protein